MKQPDHRCCRSDYTAIVLEVGSSESLGQQSLSICIDPPLPKHHSSNHLPTMVAIVERLIIQSFEPENVSRYVTSRISGFSCPRGSSIDFEPNSMIDS